MYVKNNSWLLDKRKVQKVRHFIADLKAEGPSAVLLSGYYE